MNKAALLGLVVVLAIGLGVGGWLVMQDPAGPTAPIADVTDTPATSDPSVEDSATGPEPSAATDPTSDETGIDEASPSAPEPTDTDAADLEPSTPAPLPETEPSAQDVALRPDDRVFGAEDAPVTLIEYASFTCGHCATFHNETLPELTQAYIDTGLVRFVFRDFPLDGVALRAGMLARCLPDSAYKPMVDLIFQQQGSWARADDPVLALVGLVRNAGLSEEAAQACLADEDLAQRIVEMRQEGIDRYGVNSTPSFVLEGESFAGALSFEEMAARIDAVLPSN